MSQQGHYHTHNPPFDPGDVGGDAYPFHTQDTFSPGSTDSATDVLRLHLQGQLLLGRALALENQMFRGEVDRLREQVQFGALPAGHQVGGSTGGQRSLADRIDWSGHQPAGHHTVSDDHGGVVTPPVVPTPVGPRPVGIHSRFLPLGANFQEGGTGGPMFSRLQDWPGTIHRNSSVRPHGVRQWGTHLVNFDDLHVYAQMGQMVYGGNRPPGRRDPVDPQ